MVSSIMFHPILFSLLPLCFFIFFLLKWLSPTQRTHKNLPPSPPKLPIIGNLHQLGTFPHRSLHSLAQKYGPLMHLRFGSMPVLVVSSPDAAREIMKTHDLVFSSRPKTTILAKIFYDCKDVAFSPYGEYWRQMKSLYVLHLLSNKRVQSFRHVREEEIALMIGKIEKSTVSNSGVNLSEMFVSLTNDVVCRVALGRKYGGSKFKDLFADFGEVIGAFDVGDFVPWLSWVNHLTGLYRRVDEVAKKLDDFFETVVEDHMNQQRRNKTGGEGEKDDLVEVLLEIQRQKMAGFAITRESVKALILDIFAAGTDTMSTALEWTMSEILRNPRVMKELQKEVRGIAGSKPCITEDDLEKMNYLKAVIKESLRFHMPIPLLVLREATQDAKIMGYDIAAGTMVIVNGWAIGRDVVSWNDSEEFRPERFMNSSVDFKGHDFQLIPFGAGRRGCPGIAFAMVTTELVLANLMHKFDWKLPNGAIGEDLDMTETAGLTVHKKVPLHAFATPYSF